jgi:protein transport protein SEC24
LTRTFAGLRARIDPNQIPSPVDAIETDKQQWEGRTFMTLPGNNPPLSTTDFVAFDQGEPSFLQGMQQAG